LAIQWLNTVLGNVNNSLHGAYHQISGKHLPRYLVPQDGLDHNSDHWGSRPAYPGHFGLDLSGLEALTTQPRTRLAGIMIEAPQDENPKTVCEEYVIR
jgi:hypothetical protein